MTSFTVGATPGAEDDLAAPWLRSPNRQAVTSADNAIQRLLADDPFGNGTPLREGLDKIEYPPLVMFYSIDPVSKHVEISDVWPSHP
jgi:hypothetical protein